ncbi:zinc-ribbon domain-containing protein [Shimia sp. MMG029]|uniref:zinc-ribbon domain-containing protein n=1 Tax=Shimia sp. MMG029 TaxID=3021978 RepID=UPI0022FF28F6|nr:zinc-ribbon domain-containing protein [Shimia sp. MMG029]MDA5558342.1 zinc-ribbon domain-containing protein [Shimia sp. MMG029]
MRLTCPNCGAQYEVPDDVIPTDGRDVQCSNCGNTWFQLPADLSSELQEPEEPTNESPALQEERAAEPQAEEVAATDDFIEVEPPELTIAEDTADREDTSEQDSDDVDLGGTDWDLETEDPWMPAHGDTAATNETYEEEELSDTPAAAPGAIAQTSGGNDDTVSPDDTNGPRRRGLDDSVADILREEAAFESQARAAEEPQSLETQAEFALPEAETSAYDPVEERLDRLRGQDEKRANAASLTDIRSTRRDLLPDIEEINSTLRSASDKPKRKADPRKAEEAGARRSRGFRLGFVAVLLIAAASIFVYSSHDRLSAQYPVAAPYIESFMTSSNQARIWLDEKMTLLFLKLDEMTG